MTDNKTADRKKHQLVLDVQAIAKALWPATPGAIRREEHGKEQNTKLQKHMMGK